MLLKQPSITGCDDYFGSWTNRNQKVLQLILVPDVIEYKENLGIFEAILQLASVLLVTTGLARQPTQLAQHLLLTPLNQGDPVRHMFGHLTNIDVAGHFGKSLLQLVEKGIGEGGLASTPHAVEAYNAVAV